MHKWGVLEGGVPRTIKRALRLSLIDSCASQFGVIPVLKSPQIRMLDSAGSADTEVRTAAGIACQAEATHVLRPLALPCCSKDYGKAKPGKKRMSLHKGGINLKNKQLLTGNLLTRIIVPRSTGK